MKLFIVIVHYGDIAYTKNCLASLRKKEPTFTNVIVVNNTQENIKKVLAKNIIVINNKQNMGFAKGVNIGINYAMQKGAQSVLLLNNDTYIQKPFVGALLKNLHKKSIGIAGPAIRFRKNAHWMFDIGGKIHTLFLRTSHGEVKKITEKNVQQVDYISGCCMVIKKEVFQKIGYFDESFFLYYEDADFCLRARNAGFQVVIVPSVVIQHALSKSAGKMSRLAIYFLTKSSITFGKKYARSMLQKFANKSFILLQSMLFFKANPKAAGVIARALLTG